jgi:hypothetical protein
MLVFGPLLFLALQQVIRVSLQEVIQLIWRPIVAALCMAVAVKLFPHDLIEDAPWRLLNEVVLGAATFASALMLLWWLSGRPDGIEQTAARFLSRRTRLALGSGSGVP